MSERKRSLCTICFAHPDQPTIRVARIKQEKIVGRLELALPMGMMHSFAAF
jgi:hypothetical protein